MNLGDREADINLALALEDRENLAETRAANNGIVLLDNVNQ